jgi:hypothetical protein
MADDLLPGNLVGEVAPADAISHAEATGWQRVSVARQDLAVFNDPAGSLRQVLVPYDTSSATYPVLVGEAIRRFAERENRSAHEILNDLLVRTADVLRFRVIAPGVEAGMLSVEDGARLYGGVRLSLLAAARGAIDPQRSYSKLATGSAEEFVKRCRLGQTERGSYVATVACPMSVMPERQRDAIPFARQTTGLLLNTMSALAIAIAEEREDDVLTLQDPNIVVSSNLCEAIAGMQPEGNDGELNVRCSWAPAVPQPILLPEITFTPESRPILRRMAARLKRNEPNPLSEYIASVEGFRAEPDVEKRQLGEIVVKLSDEGRAKKVRMEVTPADYATAGLAHLNGRGVSFRARLVRGVKYTRVEYYEDFAALDTLPDFSA